jgi:hypothetical protein
MWSITGFTLRAGGAIIGNTALSRRRDPSPRAAFGTPRFVSEPHVAFS